MSLRVAHLTTSHDAFDTRVFLKECRSLAAAGHDVSLVVPHTHDETRGGVRIVAVPRPATRGERATRTAGQVYEKALASGAQVCHLHDPELLPYGLLLKLNGRRVVYDAHESLPRDVRSKHYLPVGLRLPLALLVGALERGACSLLDAVVAATPGIAARLPRARVVRNLPLLSEFPAPSAVPHAERANAVVYLGGLNVIRGVRDMVRAAEHFPAGAELWLAGRFDPPALEAELAHEPGWARTRVLPWLDRAGVADTLGRARAGLLVLHAAPNHVDSLPIKLFEYMAAGLPVVASDFPLWREVLGDAGVFVRPEHPAAIAEAVRALLADPAGAEARGRAARARIERELHWERESQVLLALYAQLEQQERG